MKESDYQSRLIAKLNRLFPGCFIVKNDSALRQGIPDLLVLYKNMWAMLEVKADRTSEEQPNQDYYIQMFDEMSFAAFIYPQNEKDVLYDLQRAFQTRRHARVSQR